MTSPEETKRAELQLAELQLRVKSQILERISENFTNNLGLAAKTQYVKSDGTNYGMYTKDDPDNLTDIWERIFHPERPQIQDTLTKPTRGPGGGG